MQDKPPEIPECCINCKGSDILAHLGYAECYECGYEWSYTQIQTHDVVKVETK